MAKKGIKTDLWVARQLDDSKIKYDTQGSDVMVRLWLCQNTDCII